MPPAFRLGDSASIPACAHGCPACPHPAVGPAILGSPTVMVNELPAIRLGDTGLHAACCGPNMWHPTKGSATVFINHKPAIRLGDMTTHCGGAGQTIAGSANVAIGG